MGAGFISASLLLDGTTARDFHVPILAAPRLPQAPLILSLGILTGLLGVAYNWAVMAALRIADTSRWPVAVRAALIGAAVGALAWLAPDVIGGGDNLTQDALLAQGTILAVTGLFALRFVLGVVSYAAATPGGLFAPMLVLGTHLGLLVGLVGTQIAPIPDPRTGGAGTHRHGRVLHRHGPRTRHRTDSGAPR